MKKRPEHLLFICYQNIMRSPTAEKVIGNTPSYESKSAGLSKNAKVKLNEELLEWADRIFVMESKLKNMIIKNFPSSRDKKFIILDICDNYYFMEPELVKLIKVKVFPLIS